MRATLGADSLAFLSVEGIYRALGYERREHNSPQLTDHCFTGTYPTRLVDRDGINGHQLSLLAEAG
jgi:amidophosphoribosyltransferase